MKYKNDLSKIRKEIDEIDKIIQELLVSRASLANYIGKIKESSDTKLKKIYRPERHIEIMRAINSREKGQLSLEMISKIWNEIMGAQIILQGGLNIAVPGGEFCFSGNTIRHFFGQGACIVGCESSKKGISLLNQKKVDLVCLSYPSLSSKDHWWLELIYPESPRIIGVAPIINTEKKMEFSKFAIVGIQNPENSGDDTTLSISDSGRAAPPSSRSSPPIA